MHDRKRRKIKIYNKTTENTTTLSINYKIKLVTKLNSSNKL